VVEVLDYRQAFIRYTRRLERKSTHAATRRSILQTEERFSAACVCPLHPQELVQFPQHFNDVPLVAYLCPGLGFLVVGFGIQFAVNPEHQLTDLPLVLPVGFLG
jgi:hypothetical protein